MNYHKQGHFSNSITKNPQPFSDPDILLPCCCGFFSSPLSLLPPKPTMSQQGQIPINPMVPQNPMVPMPMQVQMPMPMHMPIPMPMHMQMPIPMPLQIPFPTHETGQSATGKRRRDEEALGAGVSEQSAAKRAKGQDVIFRIVVPSRQIGKVIGKEGCRIQRIREETKATIKIADAIAVSGD